MPAAGLTPSYLPRRRKRKSDLKACLHGMLNSTSQLGWII